MHKQLANYPINKQENNIQRKLVLQSEFSAYNIFNFKQLFAKIMEMTRKGKVMKFYLMTIN